MGRLGRERREIVRKIKGWREKRIKEERGRRKKRKRKKKGRDLLQVSKHTRMMD